MNNVILSENVKEHLNNLIDVLFKKEYFGFRESAIEYVEDLIERIKTDLPILHPRTPKYRRRVYGKNTKYIIIRKNKTTQYIVFFLQKGDKYYITYIGNNHTDARYIGKL